MSETIKLNYPIEVEGRQVEELSMRRPTVADIQAGEKQPGSALDGVVFLFARLTNLMPQDISRFDMADFHKLDDVYEGFTGERLLNRDRQAT